MNDQPTSALERRVRHALEALAGTHTPDIDGHSVPRDAGVDGRSPRRIWLAAASVLIVAGGIAALAVTYATRSDNGNDAVSSIVSAPEPTPVASTVPAVVEPSATESSTPPPPATTAPPTTSEPGATAPFVQSPSEMFVTVSDDHRAVIDVWNSVEVVATFDLTCPSNRDCVVQSARVMGDTIWVAIIDTEPGEADAIVRSRVVSVSPSTGDVTEHLALDGSAAVRSAGHGADGVLYAYLQSRSSGPTASSLVAVDDGDARVLETGVSGFRLSDDGRYLAVSFSNPPAGAPARFEITDLVDGTTASFDTLYINAGPAAWSSDGRYLVVDEQWEDRTAWVIDPWSGSGQPIAGTEDFLDGACFMSDRLIAHRTWNVGYGQGDAQLGVIRLTSLDTGSTVAEIGVDLFGDGFRCHPDGSVSYLRRPVVDVELSPDFSQLEPDYDATVELVHITPDGTISVLASGHLRMV